MEQIVRYTTARSRRSGAVLGLLVAFSVVVGGEVYRENSVAGLASSPGLLLLNVGAALGVAVVVACVAAVILPAPTRLADKGCALVPAPRFLGGRGAFLVVAAVVFLSWLPCLLSYWPGVFSYDIPTQTNYVATGHWTTQQPPVHTLIWALFLKTEGFLGLKAITWYAVAQMAFLALSFSHVLRFIAQSKASRWLWLAGFLFFAANPVMALFSITPVKDVLLAGFLSIFSVGVAKMLKGEGKVAVPTAVSMVGSATMCCLLRTNMLAAFALFALLAFVLFREGRKRVAVVAGLPMVLTLLIVGPLYSAAGITAGSSAVASVPFQQVANVVRVHADELSAEELSVVDAIIPVDTVVERYNPRFADSVVRLFRGKEGGVASVREELVEFAGQWLSWIPRYPVENVDAFLSLNVPYWYPFAQTPDPYSRRAYIETNIWKETEHYPVRLDSKLPALHDAYERVADFSALDVPVVSALFSPSSVVWVLICSFFFLYNSGRRRNVLLVLLPLVFWLTFLIGPVSNMRYVFPLFSLYPLLVCAIVAPARICDGVGERDSVASLRAEDAPGRRVPGSAVGPQPAEMSLRPVETSSRLAVVAQPVGSLVCRGARARIEVA